MGVLWQSDRGPIEERKRQVGSKGYRDTTFGEIEEKTVRCLQVVSNPPLIEKECSCILHHRQVQQYMI